MYRGTSVYCSHMRGDLYICILACNAKITSAHKKRQICEHVFKYVGMCICIDTYKFVYILDKNKNCSDVYPHIHIYMYYSNTHTHEHANMPH